ncbi:O-Antigen ligase [Rubripirellula lacrimiformis]|uniref:O-Antigen ligase n=1 Tax=Rubripirellula lacrimiformis TaxID=1930273 RepID=A0A517NGM8_9BACT|nr:O-antigen ligase family protein [Rubripirellula lacrimiformis]QDT06287.1 O-Antigen ligase [Rubripirellula lacrimiformis]
MNSTALLWLMVFLGLSLASLRRPIYAGLGHLMVFYASPVFWWFGGGLLTSLTMRWSLVAALILVVANFMTWADRPQFATSDRKFFWTLLAISVNAFFVNSFLANYPPESAQVFDILWKGCLATGLLYLTIRSQQDLELLLFGMVAGCGFVGYQVVLAGQGAMEGGRLEGIQFPGAQGSNGTAAVLSMGLVLAGYFVIAMRDRRFGIASLVFAPLILESILRCNSRGAYLGLITAGVTIVFMSRGKTRKRAITLCVLGMVAMLLLANDQNIWSRFGSIFADAEERDNSAAERLDYWEAGIKMIADYPLGSGGEATFTSPRGLEYIAHFNPNFRSVHNGPLDIAGGWGIQGLALLMSILAFACFSAWHTSKRYLVSGNETHAFLGSVLISVMVGQLVTCMFTSVLDGEWFLWLAACCLAYTRLHIASVDASTILQTEMSDLDPQDVEPSIVQ